MARHKLTPTPGGAFHTDLSKPAEYRRQEHATVLVAMIEEARAAESFSAVTALTKQLADLTGLNKPPTPRKQKPRPEPDDALDGLRARLDDTHQLRMRASREGSYVAAAALLKMESELVARVAAEVAARAPKRDAMSDQQLVDEVAADLLAMPPTMRRAVLAIVHAAGSAPEPKVAN